MKLYEMSAEIRAIYDALNDAEIPEEDKEQVIYDSCEAIGVEEKVDSYGIVYKQLEADKELLKAQVDVFKSEIDRLKSMVDAIEKNQQKMIDRMQEFLDAAGLDKFKGKMFTASYRTLPPKVVIEDGIVIPDEYCRIKKDPDKTVLKNALKMGIIVDGVTLVKERKVELK